MLTELLEHDHGQQAGARPAPCNDMERRRRLADLLAVPAGKLLPHRLDHLPLTGNRFQRARHVLAKLAQATEPAKIWDVVHFRTPQIAAFMILSLSWMLRPRPFPMTSLP